MAWPLDPPLAIASGLALSILLYAVLARYTVGTLWPRGRLDCNTWWRWGLSLAIAVAAYVSTVGLLGPTKADVEPCKTIWELTPDPWGPWRLAHTVVVLVLAASMIIAVSMKRGGDC